MKKQTNETFVRELIKQRKQMFKLIKPKIDYSKEYDIFYLWFGGNNKVDHTIEVSNDMRFDVDKKLNILSVEIDNLKEKLKEKK